MESWVGGSIQKLGEEGMLDRHPTAVYYSDHELWHPAWSLSIGDTRHRWL